MDGPHGKQSFGKNRLLNRHPRIQTGDQAHGTMEKNVHTKRYAKDRISEI
jgi:hypothetical protein